MTPAESSSAAAIVLYPSPLRGHIVSMIEFGKLLLRHHPDLNVTVLLASTATVTIASVPGLTFLRLPFDTERETALTSTPFDLAEKSLGSLRRTLESLLETTTVSALVIDCFSNSAFPVAASLSIPTFYYLTSGAIILSLFVHLPTLVETFTASFKDLKNEIIRIPGLPSVPASDMPTGLRDRDCKMYAQLLGMANNLVFSSGIIVNTSESLEQRAIAAARDGLGAQGKNPPRVFPIGPVVESRDGDEGSMVRDRHECLVWLDRQPSKSVVFLCFGSEGVFLVPQLKEIADGLERSGIRFLWVVRPPPVSVANGSNPSGVKLEELLPEGFLKRTRNRGVVVKPWVPQIDVLNHGSVGGFVTHCGWNSSIEAMQAGVPLVAWPLYAEQKVNRAFLVEEIGVAITVATREEDGLVCAEEVEGRVAELMDAGKGKGIRERVSTVRDGIEKDLSPGGSSGESLAELVRLIKGN